MPELVAWRPAVLAAALLEVRTGAAGRPRSVLLRLPEGQIRQSVENSSEMCRMSWHAARQGGRALPPATPLRLVPEVRQWRPAGRGACRVRRRPRCRCPRRRRRSQLLGLLPIGQWRRAARRAIGPGDRSIPVRKRWPSSDPRPCSCGEPWAVLLAGRAPPAQAATGSGLSVARTASEAVTPPAVMSGRGGGAQHGRSANQRDPHRQRHKRMGSCDPRAPAFRPEAVTRPRLEQGSGTSGERPRCPNPRHAHQT